jgi:hypothetical protein
MTLNYKDINNETCWNSIKPPNKASCIAPTADKVVSCDINDDFAVQLYNIEKPNAPVSLGY